MTDVLKVFHSINVQWKRIGPYNMKCLWQPPCSKYLKGKFVDQFPQTHQTKSVDGKVPPSTAANGISIRSHDSVKFELQVKLILFIFILVNCKNEKMLVIVAIGL